MLIPSDSFVDCILLLMNDASHPNKSLVTELLKIYEEEGKDGAAAEADLIDVYVRILHQFLNDLIPRDNPEQLKLVLLKLKSDRALEKRRDVFDLLSSVFTSRDSATADQLQDARLRIENLVLFHRTNKAVRTMAGKLMRARDMVSPEGARREITAVLQHATTLESTLNVTAGRSRALSRIDFRDKESIRAALQKNTKRNVTGVIKTGLQGLNLMLGKARGIARGESVVLNALPHNYKTGLLTSIALWAVIYNAPQIEDRRQPAIVMVSLENEDFQNMIWIFKKRYQAETGADPSHLTQEQVLEWIHTYFEKHGFRLFIERHLPSDFGYQEFVELVRDYEAEGYALHAAIVDYLNLAKKSADAGASNGARDLMVRDLYSRFCNFTKNKEIAFITAHALNRKAAELVGTGKAHVVKYFTEEHLGDAMDVAREVDVMIFVHIQKNYQDQPFLTMNITKHRYVDDTKERHKFCAYPFMGELGIVDDVMGAPGYTRDIYTATTNDTAAMPVADAVF